MDELMNLMIADESPSEISDSIKDQLMQERLGLVANADPYIGKYYSVDYIRRKILRQTDEELVEQDKLIKAEKAAGIILPTEQEMMMAQQVAELEGQKNKSKSEVEPEIDDSSTEAPESPGAPKGGEI